MNRDVFSLTILDDLAVVSLTGADAASFLQSQITQDINVLTPNRAALAGYCTARGRVFASMIVAQKGNEPSDGWILLTNADIAPSLVKRLRMFKLRANVDIEISEITVYGVRIRHSDEKSPRSTDISMPDAFPYSDDLLNLPDIPSAYTVTRRSDRIWISAPRRDNAFYTRWWCLDETRVVQGMPSTDTQAWHADDIAAGLPWIQAETQEAFIPQTLNMDLIDGISFTKGCYPGQEVVARSHYRGTIKRRMAYGVGAAADSDLARNRTGIDVFDANNPGNPCGRVINAAVADGKLHVLMEVQLADMDHAAFRLGADDGPAVEINALPYSLQPESV